MAIPPFKISDSVDETPNDLQRWTRAGTTTEQLRAGGVVPRPRSILMDQADYFRPIDTAGDHDIKGQ
jgi:hypothetical protein